MKVRPFRIMEGCQHITSHHLAPKLFNAPLNSVTAVLTSSKLRADIAHRACFWAADMASSSAMRLLSSSLSLSLLLSLLALMGLLLFALAVLLVLAVFALGLEGGFKL